MPADDTDENDDLMNSSGLSYCLLSAVQKGTMFSHRDPSLVKVPSLVRMSKRASNYISIVFKSSSFDESICFPDIPIFEKRLFIISYKCSFKFHNCLF